MRVVIVEDASLFREGLVRLLDGSGVEVVGTAADAVSGLELVRAAEPDAVLLDIRMPPSHTREGLDLALRLRQERPRLGVLLLSQYLESHWAVSLLGEGAGHTGYLLKERVADVAALVAALEQVVAGGTVVDPDVVAALLGRARAGDPLAVLSTRERDVLRLMAEGRSNRAIAAQLFVSEKTVDSHVRSLLQKLDITADEDDNRRVLAVLAYLRR